MSEGVFQFWATALIIGGVFFAGSIGRELTEAPAKPRPVPAVVSSEPREPTALETWWSEHYGRAAAVRTCTKESLLASDRPLYYRLCMEEKGFER